MSPHPMREAAYDEASASITLTTGLAMTDVERRSAAELSGEHRLMLAILEDAVSLYVRSLCGRTVSPREAREVRQWFASPDRVSIFAFERVCDLLGLDAAYLRGGLRALHARPQEVAARLAVHNRGRPPRPGFVARRRRDRVPLRTVPAVRVDETADRSCA